MLVQPDLVEAPCEYGKMTWNREDWEGQKVRRRREEGRENGKENSEEERRRIKE